MATIHSLAPEILFKIFELAHDPHKPTTMCAAALVCRAWRDPAQRTLFHDILVPIIPKSSPITNVTEEAMARWEAYASNRLHTPRRVELWDPTSREIFGVEIEAGSRSLRWVAGVKELSGLGGFMARRDFLSDVNLRGFTPFGINWENLGGLFQVFEPPAALVSLTLVAEYFGNYPKFYVDRIPSSVLDLSLVLPLESGDAVALAQFSAYLLPFFATVHNLHHLSFDFEFNNSPDQITSLAPSFLESLVGSLPATIKRLRVNNVGTSTTNTFVFPLSQAPFTEIKELISHNRLPNLTRLDFPDCKRKGLEDEAAAVDLLAECDDRSIRIVCWEEFI